MEAAAGKGVEVTAGKALRLTLLDLLVVAGIAIAALWVGQTIGPHLADYLIGDPVPGVKFQIQHGVPSTKDDITSLEDQKRIVDYQMGFTQVLLTSEQVSLSRASAAEAKKLHTEIGENSQFLAQLQARLHALGDSLDEKEKTLATEEYEAQKSASWSSSLRRAGDWGMEVLVSFSVLVAFGLLLLCLRVPIKRVIHPLPVFLGAAILLFGFLITAYAKWVGLLLLIIVILVFIARGRNIDRIRT